MRNFVFGLFAGLLAFPLLAIAYFRSPLVPVAASEPPMPFEKWLARSALHARVARDMPTSVPIPADEPNLAAGAGLYREHCAFCHGLPGRPANAASQGMFPRPPQLFGKRGVTDDPPGETFWKVANGIRLTGMPGYQAALTAEQMWQVSLLLAHADKLSPATQAVLAR